MKAILQTYKDRLINLSGRNRSLVLRKIHKKRTFDLSKVLSFQDNLDHELVQFLFQRKDQQLEILEDPFRYRNETLKAIEASNEEERKKELLALQETVSGIENPSEEALQVLDQRKEEINKKYDEELLDDQKKLEETVESMMGYSDHITYLLREINAVEKETGKYELYLSYPFVEGRCNDGSFVRAPLLMFPVKLKKVSNQWELSNMADSEVLVNKVFIYAYAKFNDEKLTDIDTEYSSLEGFTEDVTSGLLAYLEKMRVHIIDSKKRGIEGFVDYTNKTIPPYQSGELNLKNYMVMGQFPLSNSIYTDYQVMEQEGLYNRALESLLMNKKEIQEAEAYDSQGEDGNNQQEKTLSEQDVYFLSSLDHSQENAVARVNNQSHMVIYGPPGTGKSQTIANIICDALAKGQKVLMVSQKRAALDVIYNRLADINTKIALVHDHNKDKKLFYKKVCDVMTSEAMDYDPALNLTINDTASQIDEKLSYLRLIAKTLHSERDYGISLYDMYTKTRAITSTEDERYGLYRCYRKENPFGHYTYPELEEAKDQLVQNKMSIKSYIDYTDKIKENHRYKVFHRKLDFIEIQDMEDDIRHMLEVIRQEGQLDLEAIANLGLLYKQHGYKVNASMVAGYADEVNHKRNGHLVEETEENKWWNPSAWLHHKEIKETKENNKRRYEEEKVNLTKLYKDYHMAIETLLNGVNTLEKFIAKEACDMLRNTIVTKWDITSDLEEILAASSHLEVFLALKGRADGLSSLQVKLLDYAIATCSAIEEDEGNPDLGLQVDRVLEDDICHTLEEMLECATLMAIHEIEKTKEYNDFYLYFTMYEDLVREIKELMAKKNTLTSDMIKSKWNDRLQLFMDTPVCKEFKRQAEKKRKLWPIRKYVIEFSELLMTLFPCWLLSPETVSDILPLAEGMFDMIIFDEASQMYVENAIPTIYRGKKVVVTGDDKQLKPSSTFMARYDDYDEDMATIETAAAFEEESLLDLSKVNYPAVHLNYHYRSRYEELINFSNYAFYNGKLNISPNIDNADDKTDTPIERIFVEGTWLDRTNLEEAKEAVALVKEILQTRSHGETMGIITFNVNQKDLIYDLLDEECTKDETFKKLYQKEMNRKKGNEDVSIFVKNIENVQGDERDIIIFSIGYAPNEEGKVSVNFGALSQDGGENRLNVAISRAKEKVYVITSIEPESLKVEGTKNRGPKLFKQYLEYVREIAGRDEEASKVLLGKLVPRVEMKETMSHQDTFVAMLHESLMKRGLGVKKHVGVSDYKIDLAIYDSENARYLLGIECDGTSYRDQESARERDIHRKRFLESRGWELQRVWSMDWWKDPNQVLQNIDDRVATIKECIRIEESSQVTETFSQEDMEEKEPVAVEESQEENLIYKKEVFQPKEIVAKQVTVAVEDKAETKEQQDTVKPVNPIFTIWFGDVVYIKDLVSKKIHQVPIESDPYKKDDMSDFHKNLLGRKLDEKFTHLGSDYTVVGIDKQ